MRAELGPKVSSLHKLHNDCGELKLPNASNFYKIYKIIYVYLNEIKVRITCKILRGNGFQTTHYFAKFRTCV